MFEVDNAIIMAAGTSARFAPLSYEKHKALTVVKGEVLIERQIRQLKEAGINRIYIVTGYKAEQFEYLKQLFAVTIIHNSDYLTRNNNSSIWYARDVIRNSYICSADNYFASNLFERTVDGSYYSALYSRGPTDEWCMEEKNGYIRSVHVGGRDSWYMLGHAFWDERFSKRFLSILEAEYERSETVNKLWEDIYIDHIDELPIKIRKYADGLIYEFDTLDELRGFDSSYVTDTRSEILKQISRKLHTTEEHLTHIEAYKDRNNAASGFTFTCEGRKYKYSYEKNEMEDIKDE